MQSPHPCPSTITIRRNPPRRARPTPSSAQIPPVTPLPSTSSSVLQTIPSFPIDDILSIDVPQNPTSDEPITSEQPPSSTQQPIPESLKVFLRIRPLPTSKIGAQGSKARAKNAWPQNPSAKNPSKKPRKKSEVCISVNDSHSVTLCPPAVDDGKRSKAEVYDGFSHVFSSEDSQEEVFLKMVNPLVDEFLKGKSGMLAAMGPSGSGKTHTVFGTAREPGMVPRTLRRIFSQAEGSRIFLLSMFEIYSERGKGEKIIDLSLDGEDSCSQQATIKGLQEVMIYDSQQAEQVIAKGMLKRATAMTNSNSQSSRSQCIINIRCALDKIDEGVGLQSRSAVFTFVDLAGAEREKKTGNQGARLLESNFINNTSMVFGLCLRSLLEHQKNPKKPLQRHFQNSLLTKYLRHYLEGKKRMAMLLTVKSGEDDYLDASLMLRQASPYMKIKFDNVEEPVDALCSKRPSSSRIEQPKRMKLSASDLLTKRGKAAGECHRPQKEEAPPRIVKEIELVEHCSELEGKRKVKVLQEESTELSDEREESTELPDERKNKVMQDFAKAIWNVLKEYKKKLEVAEIQIESLRENLSSERKQRSDLETELGELKAHNLHKKDVNVIGDDQSNPIMSAEQERCQSTVPNKTAEIHFESLGESRSNERGKRSELESELGESKSYILYEQEVSPIRDDQTSTTRSSEQEVCKPIVVDEMAVIRTEGPIENLSNEMAQHSGIENDIGGLETCNSHQREVWLSRDDQSRASSSTDEEICPPTVIDEIAETRIRSLRESLSSRGAEPSEIETKFGETTSYILHEKEVSLTRDEQSSTSKSGEQDRCQPTPTLIDEMPEIQIESRRESLSNAGVQHPELETDLGELKTHVLYQKESPSRDDESRASTSTEQEACQPSVIDKCNNEDPEGLPGDADFAEDTRKADISINADKSDRVSSNSVTTSPTSPGTITDSCYTAENHQSNSDEVEKILDKTVLPEEAAKLSPRYKTSCAPKSEPLDSGSKILVADKPRRRLQPSSCNLLRNISSLEFEDENDKPKASRGEKKVAPIEQTKTLGSTKLIRLLKTKPSSGA